MSRRPELPPKVEAHVQRQLVRADWDALLRDLRTMCADCPADRDPDICVNCPLEGIAIDAATLTLRAQIEKMKKSKIGKKVKRQILTDLKSGTPKT